MNLKTGLFALTIAAITSCGKKGQIDDIKPTPTPPTSTTKSATSLLLMNNFAGGSGPSTWAVFNGSTRLNVYAVASNSNYRLEYHGQNGGDIARGNVLGSSSDQITFDIQGYDTLKVFSNNDIVEQYILQPSNGDVAKQVSIEKTSPNQTADNLRASMNTYVQNTLPTLKMNRQ